MLASFRGFLVKTPLPMAALEWQGCEIGECKYQFLSVSCWLASQGPWRRLSSTLNDGSQKDWECKYSMLDCCLVLLAWYQSVVFSSSCVGIVEAGGSDAVGSSSFWCLLAE